ncbi:MAG: Rne/Rng family ribonuclease [Rhodococcus sp.]|nr:Rne/Rng family ribonuclease [Rhodococcus sp. (in: high G+C Gram-positive bacteria)]
MAELEPPTNSESNSVAAGSDVPALPAKIRVHALAKLLGVTSKQVIAEAAKLGTELRSAHSSVVREAAEQIRAALTEPERSDTAPEAPAHTAPDVPVDTAPQVPAETAPSLFTSPGPDESGSGDLGASADAGSEPNAVAAPAADVPLFLQPDPSAAPVASRRRRSRRGAAAPDAADDQGTAELSSGIDNGPGTAEARHDEPANGDSAGDSESSESDQTDSEDDQPRRRRRGRRGRGRGRGEQNDQNADEGTDKAESGSGDRSKNDDASARKDDKSTSGADDQSKSDDTEGAAEETETGSAAKKDDADEAGEGTSRRRRRRRRRKSGGDSSADTGSEDDPPNTVVHEREPRNKNRSKDEVQGISGSTRLEAKRQRRRDGRDAGRRRPPILSESEFLARRESVDRVMVVRDREGTGQPQATTQVAVLEDSVLVEHFVTTSASSSMVGNVYLGRVQNVLPSMEAAFIDIGRGRNGVLYAGEVNWEAAGLGGNSRKIEQALKPGDMVLVQVSKDPVGHKGARLTTQISLAGRFLVYVPGGTSTGISRKLPDTERKRLKEILREVVPSDAGVIIRTASEGVSEEELSRDVQRLQKQWTDIEEKAAKADAGKSGNPQALYEEPDLLVKVIRDLFNEDFSKLVIEGEKAWSTVQAYIESVAPDLLPRLEQYTDSGSGDVFAAHRIDEQLSKALDRKVWLPSGGTLVIDRTEAMTVVDVNTGKFTGAGGNLEETVTRNNLEAAEEIVRQMRLRDIGGMIVVDFIDMVLEANRDLVLRRLTESLGRDRTRHQVSEVTSLGLVQMTRKKLGTGLVEAFSTNCEHCHGRGIIVHADPVEVKSTDDSGSRSGSSGGSRKRRGRDKASTDKASNDKNSHDKSSNDKGSNQTAGNGQSSSSEQTAEATAEATVKRAHPVALAMAHHLHDEAPKADEAHEIAQTSDADEAVEAPKAAETPKSDTAAEEASHDESVSESAEPVAAVQAEPVVPEKPRRRSRRASRAASAPAGAASEGTVVVISATEQAEAAHSAAAAEKVSAGVPVPETPAPAAPSRPRRRRAAGRPAGPPVEADS